MKALLFLLAALSTQSCASKMKENYEEPRFGEKSYTVAYPNKLLTPGKIIPTVGKEEVCTKGYARMMRDELTKADKIAIYKNYGVPYDTSKYQMDHLVPLSLGGSNDTENLWPQPLVNNAGFREKQQVAQWLHEKVCSGQMPIFDAQKIMIEDWHNGWHMLQKEKTQKKKKK